MENKASSTLSVLCNECSPNIQVRLRAINKILSGFKRNNLEPTVPKLTASLSAMGINISSSSLYNKKIRGKPNPYRVLYDAWLDEISNDKSTEKNDCNQNQNFISLTDSDYSSISNDIVKFKIQMMFNELKSARHQINMLKQVQNLPIIEDNGSNLLFHNGENNPNIEKNGIEPQGAIGNHLDILKQFLNGNGKIEFDQDGYLVSKKIIRKGDPLSDLGLKSAIIAALEALSK